MTLPNRHMKNYLPIILGLGALICSCANSSKNEAMVRMLVGTLSEADGGAAAGKGIYLMEFNQDDASYRILDSLQSGNPTFMAPSADWSVLYSVNEFHDGRQAASSYIMGEKGLAFTNTVSTDLTSSGADPCNILELPDCIVTSNYTGGTLSAFRKEAVLAHASRSSCQERTGRSPTCTAPCYRLMEGTCLQQIWERTPSTVSPLPRGRMIILSLK